MSQPSTSSPRFPRSLLLVAFMMAIYPAAGFAAGTVEDFQANAHGAFDHRDWSRAADLYRDLLDESGHLVTLEERQVWATRRGQALLKQGQFVEALPSLLEARHMARASGIREPELDSLIGWTYLQIGDLAEAIPALDAARQAWRMEREAKPDALQRATMMRRHVHVGRLLQWAHLQDGDAESAYRVSEEARAQSLLALFASREPELVDERPWTYTEAQALARDLSTTLVSYTVLGSEERILGDEPRDERMVLIYVVSPDGTSAGGQALTGRSSTLITDLVLALTPAMQDDDERAAHEVLAELYDILIRPVASLLPESGGSLTILPSGPLHLVPFAALLDRGDDGLEDGEPTEPAHLVDRYEIRYGLSAAQVKASLRRSVERQGNGVSGGLIVGHRDSPDRRVSLQPLLGAEREATAVAEVVGGTALLGSQARKTAGIRGLAGAPFVHLASPAVMTLDPRRRDLGQPTFGAKNGRKRASAALASVDETRVPLAGGIAFADGLLFAGEIVSLDVGARLAVLSASDVGEGQITQEGAVGLRWAFLAAGVPGIVSSLWSQPDAPTAELMPDFYQRLLAGESTTSALRGAMLELRDSHPHPRDWAAFTHTGVSRLAN